METSVTGIYSDPKSVEKAVGQLVASGFAREEISVILRATPDHERLVHEETEDTPRGVIAGAISGGVLASLAFGLLALPSMGVFAAGPLLAGLTAGGAGVAAGGLIGGMVGLGTASQQAEEYELAIQQGAALLAVHTVHSRVSEAKEVLERTAAISISDSVHFAGKHGEAEG
ncbi:MAG: DUF3341 domain-containing protein [Planctomycetota bacterium]